MIHILNALPGAIIPAAGGNLRMEPISWTIVRNICSGQNWVSAVGHLDTAAIISGLAGFLVPMNRVSVPVLRDADQHILVLYQGPRLAEGSTTLPEGATLSPYLLTFEAF